ncbi:MAG: MaoC family dehydratase [Saprospiraceae bacterium]|jgi:3-hydroxybutyryl-CoA dehydratase|nr:MaoC family dehydratase [Saprospiraceae bacterium]MBK7795279.1 MaoC family dehydratase [Saprospiraceae bacterium]MBK9377892.1 MaoC family dehydratase [Saprospiraceae bacterium]MBL0261832.1 MaoC family dehydratase [Saprospiraceae bacterium]
MLQIGDQFKHTFAYSQSDVDTFARVSGDTNPLHIDPEAGKNSMFGKCIIHGFLGGAVFTKIFGALWKADGHVYLKQTMQWLRPMFVDTDYQAVITVKEVYKEKNRVLYDCSIFELSSGEQVFTGEALLMNKKQYIWE